MMRVRVKCGGCASWSIFELEGLNGNLIEGISNREIYKKRWGCVNELTLKAIEKAYEEMLQKKEDIEKHEFYGSCPHCQEGMRFLVWTPIKQ
jgi:hypothetical protein